MTTPVPILIEGRKLNRHLRADLTTEANTLRVENVRLQQVLTTQMRTN